MDRAGISADRAYHTDLRRENLRESARAAGDMFGGGSSVVFDGAKIRKFRFLFVVRESRFYVDADALRKGMIL